MPVTVTCPNCSSRAKAPDAAAGKTLKCPSCNVPLTVPLVGASRGVASVLVPVEESKKSARTRTGFNKKIIVGVICSVLLVAAVTLGIREFTKSRTPVENEESETRLGPPALAFHPQSAHATARWAGELLEPMNAALKIENGIVRNDTVLAEEKKARAKITPLVGQKLAWDMRCIVEEKFIGLFEIQFGKDRHLDPTMEIDAFDDNPNVLKEALLFAIPQRISREDAAKLKGRVTLNATVKSVEFRTFMGSKGGQRYLLGIYVTDVKLSVPSEP